MLLNNCVYCDKNKDNVNKIVIVIPLSDKAEIMCTESDLLKSHVHGGGSKQCETKYKRVLITAVGGLFRGHSGITEDKRGLDSELVLAFTGPAWPPRPTSEGL